MSAALEAVLARCQAADAELRQTMRRDYPPGATIAWRLGGPVMRGTVVHHNSANRLTVRFGASNEEAIIGPRDIQT